ncbi:MAG: site-2 protease family protein [Kiritimatiellales bacterium]
MLKIYSRIILIYRLLFPLCLDSFPATAETPHMIKSSYLLTTVMRIPIRIHITLIILLILIAFASGLYGVLLAAGLFGCVAAHELGHSWVAIKKGCRVHEILLLPIGGVAKMSGLPTSAKSELLIALAGPVTSFLLFVFFIFLAPVSPLLASLAGINLMLCLFNLLPSFPMDGGRIFRAVMTPKLGLLKATGLAVRIGKIMAVVFGVFGLMTWNWILILIAIFIYQAAGAEYRSVAMMHAQRQWVTLDEPDIEVSPPPYAAKPQPFWKTWQQKTNSFFNDLFKNWNEG